MTKQKKSALSNTKIAIVFFVFLVFVIGLSLGLKIIGIISQGQFDSSKRFNLVISNSKNTKMISFSGSKNIAILKLDKNIEPLQAGRFLQVPVDGFINYKNLDLNQKVSSMFFKSMLNYKDLKTNLTSIDLLKLFTFAAGVKESSITVKTISSGAEGIEIDKIVNRLAADELIEKDNQTIQIINGTDIAGLGNRLARLITNMGGDVIIVATSDAPHKRSSISYIDKKTYTVEKLSKVLGYDTIMANDNAISDITIIIGEDKAVSSPF